MVEWPIHVAPLHEDLRKQVEEDRESWKAYEKAGAPAESKTAEQKADVRAVEQQKQLFNGSAGSQEGGQEGKNNQHGQSQEASTTGDEDELPAPPASDINLRIFSAPDMVMHPPRLAHHRGPTWTRREWTTLRPR